MFATKVLIFSGIIFGNFNTFRILYIDEMLNQCNKVSDGRLVLVSDGRKKGVELRKKTC